MGKIYGVADSFAEMAADSIRLYHTELATARIKYVFVSEGAKKNGKIVPGKAKKLSGSNQFLVDADFVIEVALDCWNDLRDTQRLALVDHLLECCTGEEAEDGSMKWVIREPDVREFSSILERHGAWHEGLVELVSVAKTINVETLIDEVMGSPTNNFESMIETVGATKRVDFNLCGT